MWCSVYKPLFIQRRLVVSKGSIADIVWILIASRHCSAALITLTVGNHFLLLDIPIGPGPPLQFPRSHSDTPHLVWLLWTSDWQVAESYAWQHTILTRQGHSCPQRDSKPQPQQASSHRHMTVEAVVVKILFFNWRCYRLQSYLKACVSWKQTCV
jgi:hypothetical protein